MSDLTSLAATDLGRHSRATDLIDALTARAARVEPMISSLLETDASIASAARTSDATPDSDRGCLHGVPFAVKGNIDVGSGLHTTAGSMALWDVEQPTDDAPVIARLRAEGALLWATTNLSEWANFRAARSSSGWSALGGQCRNPHAHDHSPGGSSSGSAAAVAARLIPFALGTETDGSILNPAAFCGVVGMKPTVGTVPTRGVIPIAASQDVVGPIARSVADAALVLGVIADDLGPVRLDPNALLGRRIGVGRAVYCGYDEGVDTAFEDALSVLSSMGAAVVDPADIATAVDLRDTDHEITVMLCEFKDDLQAYIATRSGAPANLEQLIEFNTAHANVELAFFGQDIFEKAAATSGRADPSYKPAREACIRLARTEGIDATIARHQLDALVWPTGPTAWHIGLETGGNRVGFSGGSTPTAVAGYPAITVPSGTSDGLPVGIQFSGPAGSDALLLELAFAYEQASHLLVDAIPSSGG